MKKRLLVFAALVSVLGVEADTTMKSEFLAPPDSARPGALWYWRHELHTKEGITADLETMARVGVGEMIVGFIGNYDVPIGDVAVLSPKWWDLMRHTAREANRVGVKLRFFNSPGWSSTGGPWITPEMAMQSLVWSELRVTKPGRLSAPLPHPPTADTSALWRFSKEYAATVKPYAYLGDVAVIAFPTLAAERWEGAKPKLSCADKDFRPEAVSDGDIRTVAKLANPAPDKPVYLQFEYPAPFPARSLSFVPRNAPVKQIQLEASDDGSAWRIVAQWAPRKNGDQPVHKMFAAAPARYWRIGVSGPGPFMIAELALKTGALIEDWSAKAMRDEYGYSRPPFAFRNQEVRPGEAIAAESILDLTDKLKSDGTLDWEAPAGDWTVIRFGRILSLKANAPAAPSGCGLECDKYNPAAVNLHWKSFVAPLLADKDLNEAMTGVHIDSYEKGAQSWSPCVPAEFRKRAGYDVRPFLPVLTGRVVDSVQTSERFLWDFRKTLCDAMADNYYGRMAELAHENGKILSIEPYHQTQFDTDVVGVRGDAVMTEFHLGGVPGRAYFKNAASPAHIAGIKRVEAEAFTSMPKFGGDWSTAPWDMKALGDHAFACGVNRYMFHVSNQQPWLDVFPGVASPWGQHIERGNTWFNFSYGWLRYIARCQYLLQQGRYVGDFLVSTGENAPNQEGVRLDVPQGYEYDLISPEAILTRLELKDGMLTTGALASYAPLFVLPPEEPYMTVAMARKLKVLVEAGMTLVGPRPAFSPTLKARAQEDRDFQRLIAELWGEAEGKKVTVNRLGKGRVVWGQPLGKILAEQLAVPQFVGCDKTVTHIRRQSGDTEIWFVASANDKPVSGDCAFRTTMGQPELWDAMTGQTRPLEIWRQEKGCVVIPMRFEPRQSWFVVFRGKDLTTKNTKHTKGEKNFSELKPILELTGAWEVQFDPKWFYSVSSQQGQSAV
ncbi:MAG: glycosyl hydrolase, partial [bacterium]